MKLLPLSMTMLLASALVFADDGALQSKNVSMTPDWDTEHASLQQLWFYVPAQTSDFTLLTETDEGGIQYCEATDPADPDNCIELGVREYARPLIAFYEDGPVEIPEDSGGFYGHGERDMNAAVSLDDGATWKRSNLSKSADKSSIAFKTGSGRKTAYPGDVFRNFTAVAGNKVLAVWASRYCGGGNPNYSLPQPYIDAVLTEHLDKLGNQTTACTDIRLEDKTIDPDIDDLESCLYFGDAWGVAGSQGIKDFEEEGYPTVGLVPYACMWAARGTLESVDELGAYDEDGLYKAVIWRKAERLSSGRRDAHRMEAACVGGAGCVVTWQEDPDGLRPGDGEGPGEGWSGAVAHHETDIWYSYIDWDAFDLVLNSAEYETVTEETNSIVTLVDYNFDLSNAPKVGIPFSIPVRLTDNAMCKHDDPLVDDDADDPYCYFDLDDSLTLDVCATFVEYTTTTPEGPNNTNELCVTEDGRLMRGNTASTRARTNLRGYDSDGDGATDSGWVILAYEESKGLGEDAATDKEDIAKYDMGKNIWYHTFNMFEPELVSQGMMLNQPAIYPDDVAWVDVFAPDESDLIGTVELALEDASAYTDYVSTDNLSPCTTNACFAYFVPDPIYGKAELDSTLYQTEIARRYSQITQPASMVGESGTVGLMMYKQGIIRRGGPADVFGRRFVLPGDFDAATDNPFDYANMVCGEADLNAEAYVYDGDWKFTDGSNPRYVKGLCMATPISLSGTTVAQCYDSDLGITGDETDGCSVQQFPFDEHFADLIGGGTDPSGQDIPKISYWAQCEAADTNSTIVNGTEIGYTCADRDINDQSWENPFDVAKGHRGFMYGDFVMAMYAWSPNWKDNAAGKDNYNLYVRRSFDGGQSWTTYPGDTDFLPETFEGAFDPSGLETLGSKHCEWYQPETQTEYDSGEDPVCYQYGIGQFEQARNLSQMTGRQMTVLDPRYAPTDPSFLGDLTKEMITNEIVDTESLRYPDDAVNPSRFFATYEEGDTAEIAEGGEGMPMDMFYARAINFGDQYELGDEFVDGIADVDPLDEIGDEDTLYEAFDKLECTSSHAAEASLKSSPGGTFFYATWQAWKETDTGFVYDSDAIVRRSMELDIDDPEFGTATLALPYVTYPSFGCGGGGNGGGGGGGGGGDGTHGRRR